MKNSDHACLAVGCLFDLPTIFHYLMASSGALLCANKEEDHKDQCCLDCGASHSSAGFLLPVPWILLSPQHRLDAVFPLPLLWSWAHHLGKTYPSTCSRDATVRHYWYEHKNDASQQLHRQPQRVLWEASLTWWRRPGLLHQSLHLPRPKVGQGQRDGLLPFLHLHSSSQMG